MLKSKGIISGFQRKILTGLQNLPDFSNFYLTGGTALSEFYLGHRRSFDLDIFTAEDGLVLPFSRTVEKELKNQGFHLEVIRRFSTFVDFELSEKKEITRLHFAYDSPFRFENPIISDISIKVNDYKDLIVDKLLSFFGRTEPRDAVDLFFILKKENIWELANLAAKKDPGFDLYWLAIALEKCKDFPDDIKRWPVEMLIQIRGEELKNKFIPLAREILEKLKNKK
jgi:predicted nucleotidyltransferase component of viral defense system